MNDFERLEERLVGAYEAIRVAKTWIEEDMGLDETPRKGNTRENTPTAHDAARKL